MRLPQELIDAIIRDFDLSEKYDSEIEETLKSCALVARPFVRPCQTRLFARISVRDHEENSTTLLQDSPSSSPHNASIILSRKLSTLLSHSPHLARYIRTLDICYNATTTEATFVPGILSAITELNTLILTDYFCEPFPMNSATVAVFSLPSLRRAELRRYQFANPFELETLLRGSKCLQELILLAIEFRDESSNSDNGSAAADAVEKSSTGDVILLETLTLVQLHVSVVELMLNFFTAVDIRHLASLSLLDNPIAGILRANAASIQKLQIERNYTDYYVADTLPDPGMMPSENRLNFLDFQLREIGSLVTHLPLFGDLGNLKALETLRITLHLCLDADTISEDEEWTKLDRLLLPLPSNVKVEIYAAFDSQESGMTMDAQYVKIVEKCLPLLSGRGMLQVYYNPSREPSYLL